MVNYEDNLTPLGRQMKAEREAMAAQANPAMMGVPQGGTGGQIKFDRNALMQAYQASMAGPDAGRWFRIKGADGQSYAVAPNGGELAGYTGEGQDRQYNYGANTGFRVFTDPGDFGGGWLTDGPEAAKMNGRPYDALDASGNFAGSGQFKDWQDSGVMGPWGALAVLAMPFAAAAMGLGAGAAAGAAGAAEGGAAAAGAAGASEAAGAAAALSAGEAALPTTFGIVDTTAFAPAAAASSGTGLTMGGGGLGLTGSAGPGMTLAGGGGAGITAASPGAAAVGGGLGATGLAAGSGSLLSPSVLAGAGSAATSVLGGAPSAPSVPAAASAGGLIPGVSNGQLLGAAGSLVGGALGSNAASTAAEQQLQSTRESNALLERMFEKQIALQEPFRQNGLATGNRMMTLLGTGGDPNAADYGSFNKPFTAESLYADPSYQFRKDEGAKAVTHGYAGKGNFLSGAGAKALDRYGSDYASGEYGTAWNRDQTSKTNQFNRYASVYGSGQTAANTQGNAAGTYGQNASQNIQAGGNAQAAGTVGSANAWSNTLNGIWNNYSQNELMNQLLRK